jgi:poly(3-hydroxybutyrate) depolymerase
MRRTTLPGGVAALAWVLLLPTGASGQVEAGITELAVSRSDPTQEYALFVPSTYRPGTPHPLLLVLDSRGRALLPLERLAPTAERLGWLVMSSYQSRSDEAGLETDRAVMAMIEDAQDLFTVDTRRLYFAGLSGNARQSWLLAGAYQPYTAGILGFGAALPGSTRLVEMEADGPVGFAFFGGAGTVDYNNHELRSLDWRLDEYSVAHFVTFYPGEHEWPD